MGRLHRLIRILLDSFKTVTPAETQVEDFLGRLPTFYTCYSLVRQLELDPTTVKVGPDRPWDFS